MGIATKALRHLVVEEVVANVHQLLVDCQERQLGGIHLVTSQLMQEQVQHLFQQQHQIRTTIIRRAFISCGASSIAFAE